MPVKRHVLALLPGCLLVAAAGVALLIPAVRDGAGPIVPIAIYAIAAAGVLVGLRFRNVRAVTALVVLALADQVVTRWVPSGGAALSTRPATAAVALLLPLNFAALAWTPERRVAWRWMKLWTVLLVVEIVLVALLVAPPAAGPAFVAWRTVFDAVSRYWATLGLPLVVPVAGAFVLAFVRFMLRPRPLDAGLVWALMISWLALGLGGEHLVVRLFLATDLVHRRHHLVARDVRWGLSTRCSPPSLARFEPVRNVVPGPFRSVRLVGVDL